jgi:hypothetical protein
MVTGGLFLGIDSSEELILPWNEFLAGFNSTCMKISKFRLRKRERTKGTT